ncbi:uncharacterized protein LOC143537430 [Bidens hawaiensis]|uniref:uncharacterized protein LOC143537430 n=1 Tax=Bidens hawaiensis TaxID=980011 RepID=UPI0040494598
MPFPDAEYISIASNSLIHEELSYDQNLLKVEFHTLFNSITHEQKNVFDHIMMAVQQNKDGVFLVYGYGGTDIGEGNAGSPNDGVATIDIPVDLLIKDSVDPISKLFDFDRAILALTNEIVDEINDSLLKFFPGDEVEYLSSDTICSLEYINDTADTALYSHELLNGLRISGLSNHKLVLKVGVPVMLLRNLNQKEGLCNGTRLQIISLGTRVVEAKIISRTNTYVLQ